MKSQWWLIALAALCVLALAVLFVPDERIFGWRGSIDIAGGRYRRCWYFLWVKVADRVEDTCVSTMYRELVGELPRPIWRFENESKPGLRINSLSAYHGSRGAIDELCQALESDAVTPEARREVIVVFLDLLRRGPDRGRACMYATSIYNLVLGLEARWRAEARVDVEDLPMPPE